MKNPPRRPGSDAAPPKHRGGAGSAGDACPRPTFKDPPPHADQRPPLTRPGGDGGTLQRSKLRGLSFRLQFVQFQKHRGEKDLTGGEKKELAIPIDQNHLNTARGLRCVRYVASPSFPLCWVKRDFSTLLSATLLLQNKKCMSSRAATEPDRHGAHVLLGGSSSGPRGLSAFFPS